MFLFSLLQLSTVNQRYLKYQKGNYCKSNGEIENYFGKFEFHWYEKYLGKSYIIAQNNRERTFTHKLRNQASNFINLFH